MASDLEDVIAQYTNGVAQAVDEDSLRWAAQARAGVALIKDLLTRGSLKIPNEPVMRYDRKLKKDVRKRYAPGHLELGKVERTELGDWMISVSIDQAGKALVSRVDTEMGGYGSAAAYSPAKENADINKAVALRIDKLLRERPSPYFSRRRFPTRHA